MLLRGVGVGVRLGGMFNVSPHSNTDKSLANTYQEMLNYVWSRALIRQPFRGRSYDRITYDDLVRQTMQIYDYVIVRVNKAGEFREILYEYRILARDETGAKALALKDFVVNNAEFEDIDFDRIEVVVRPF